MTEFIFFIDEDTGRHQKLQRPGFHLPFAHAGILIIRFPLIMLGHELALDALERIGDMLVGRGASRAVVHKDLFIRAQDAEDIVVVDDGLRPAEEKIAAVVEGHMKDGKKIPLQDILKIDQEVPAAHQIQPAEGRILEHIVLGKDDHLADVVVDRVAVSFFGEKAGETRDRDILENTVPVDAASRDGDGITVEIRRKYLDITAQSQLLHSLSKEDRYRIGLLTCGTARHPDPDLVGRAVALEQVLDDTLLEDVKIVRIAEEAGDPDQDLLGQEPDLLGIIGHVIDIFPQVPVMGDHDPPLDPAKHRRLLVIRIVDIRDFFKERKHLAHQVAVRELQTVSRVRDRPGDMGHLTGDTVGVENEVGEACRDGAPGHAVKLGALRRLCDDQPVALLDLPDPVGPVGTRARQDDRDRAVFIGLCQRTEKDIDGMVYVLVVVLAQMQLIRLDLHIVLGGQHIHRIFADMHPLLCLQDRHGRIFSQNIRQQTPVVRRQVLDDHKRHPRIRREEGQELLQSLQSSCRRPDPDHTAGFFILHTLSVCHSGSLFSFCICPVSAG